jgi:transcriptional regulator with XRE-family HTH domain
MVRLTRLRSIRERRALSQQELADKAGLSRVAVVRIESGTTEPYPSTVRKLASALGVQPHELMEPMEGEAAA